MKATSRFRFLMFINIILISFCIANMIFCIITVSIKPNIITAGAIGFSIISTSVLSICVGRDIKKLWAMKKSGYSFCGFCNGKGYRYLKNLDPDRSLHSVEFSICRNCNGTGKIDWIQKIIRGNNGN